MTIFENLTSNFILFPNHVTVDRWRSYYLDYCEIIAGFLLMQIAAVVTRQRILDQIFSMFIGVEKGVVVRVSRNQDRLFVRETTRLPCFVLVEVCSVVSIG